MTREEWEYVLNNRTTVSEIRYAIAQVNGVNGLILLPDDWRATYFTLNNTNQNSADFSSNIINLEQWSTLEQYGAVFLPAAGVRIGTSVRNIGSELDYWSASSYSNYMAYCIRLYDGYTSITSSYRRRGQSVRLVRSIHTYGINATSNSVESGTVMGTGVYFEGSTCTLTATANEGYTFINWMKGEEEVSTEPEYSFTVTEDADFVANFASDGYHWALPEGYPNTMTVTGVVLVDSVEQHIPSWEIGAFYGDECRGRERLANEQRSNQGRLYFNLVVYGEEDGEEITFRLYDHINEQEMDMECETELPFTSGETYGDPNNLMGLNFIHDATITQTTQFNNGWNWFSTNVEITLDDLKAALVAALPGTNITISSQNSGSTTYNGSNWRGTLNTLDVTQMYKIKTAASCQLELTGEPLNPAEHPITIHNGANWIGFPLNVSMSLNNAFAGFAVSGDIVRSKDGSATYNGSTWRGNLNMLVPGQGYIYKSSVQDNRTFTFGTNK